MGSYRMPSLIPLTVYTGIVPIAGVLILLFTLEQLVNGWQQRLRGPRGPRRHAAWSSVE